MEPFLTAVGPGLPAFAAYEQYHQQIFSFHDELMLNPGGHLGSLPATGLSYMVVGWYSSADIDILARAVEIPGLLAANATPQELLKALEWELPGLVEGDSLRRSVYCGTALGLEWEPAEVPKEQPGLPPKPLDPKMQVGVGHSTAEAAGAIASRQMGERVYGDLVRALFLGTADTFGTVLGEEKLEEATRQAWFTGVEGGYVWEIRRRAQDDPRPVPPAPVWLEVLNARQREYDTVAAQLGRDQWRMWTLWWLKNQPAAVERPADFNTRATEQLNPQVAGTIAHRVAALYGQAVGLLEYLPHGTDPEDLEREIERFLVREGGLAADLQLKRVSQDPYYKPADPVVVITNAGGREPLGRDKEDPLPCRLPSRLVTRIQNGSASISPDPLLTPAQLGQVPDGALFTALLKEFSALDKAAHTPASGGSGSALQAALADLTRFTGTPAEYTAVWPGQAWTPMYLRWELDYCPVPFRTGTTDNWSFNGTDYDWQGTGAPDGDGEGHRSWLSQHGRCLLTPTTAYVSRRQAQRFLDTYGDNETGDLSALVSAFEGTDLLSQRLEGFNDWLLEQDSAGRRVPEADELGTFPAHFADPATVPSPDEYNPSTATTTPARFQALRSGQFYFRDLRIIDRFGRVCDRTNIEDGEYKKFHLTLTPTTTPTHPIGPDIPEIQWDRFVQLPPRLLQGARCRFEAVRASDNTAFTTPAPVPDDPR
ncbi:hypothetical protein ACWCZ5_34245, partial [Streptomyces sp. NPDC001667]